MFLKCVELCIRQCDDDVRVNTNSDSNFSTSENDGILSTGGLLKIDSLSFSTLSSLKIDIV